MIENPSDNTTGITQVLTEQAPQSSADTSNEIISDGELEAGPVNFSVDSSLEFRQSLEKSGNRYHIQKLLATGGFGRIFLARDRILGRPAVIKSLREELLAQPDTVKKFIAEAKLSAQLDHPAIVPLFSLDSDSTDGLHLAMQFVNGITLQEYLHRSREQQQKHHYGQMRYNKSLRERLEMFLHICDAIEYSHNRHIIHCDLKPANIMIGRYGEVYVMDWGSACEEGTDRKGHADGTPSYMAPESLQEGATTQQTDVFALGMILNEIATLRRPVFGSDCREIINRICSGEFEPSTPLDPARRLAPALRAIIEKARAVDPASRYQCVKHLAADVRHYLFNEEVEAYPDSMLQKLMRLMYRHRYLTLFLIMAVLCASGAMAVYGMQRENHVLRQVNREMIRNLQLQSNTEKLATEVNSRLLRLQDQLRTLSLSLGIGMAGSSADSGKEHFYMVSEFAPDSKTPPPGLIATRFYKHPITLEHAAYFKEGDVTDDTLKQWGHRLRGLHPLRLAHFFDNLIRQDSFVHAQDENMRQFFLQGGILRRITYILDNGIALRFPGMYEEVASNRDFQCDWIRRAYRTQPHRLIWSPPYPDTSGHMVVSCWRPVLDRAGKEIGTMGFEVCYHELLRPIFEQGRRENFQTLYILLDSEGREIFTSERRDFEQQHADIFSAPASAPEWPAFRCGELLKRIRRADVPQFTATVDGQKMRVSWSSIGHAGWTLIQLAPQDSDGPADHLQTAARQPGSPVRGAVTAAR